MIVSPGVLGRRLADKKESGGWMKGTFNEVPSGLIGVGG